jgi:hypothetical protein
LHDEAANYKIPLVEELSHGWRIGLTVSNQMQLLADEVIE